MECGKVTLARNGAFGATSFAGALFFGIVPVPAVETLIRGTFMSVEIGGVGGKK